MPARPPPIPPVLAPYLRALVQRSGSVLGDALVAVYAGGSVALGAYEHGPSDVDVAVVVREPLAGGTKAALADALRHESLPCPARGLELVVYTRAAAAAGVVEPAFELNLNTGATMAFHADETARPEGGTHWFAIDRSILRQHGVPLLGPPADETFAAIPRAAILPLLVDSLTWHAAQGLAEGDNAVLNACRALRFAREGQWSSKPEAGAWAIGRVGDAAPVVAALAARDGGPAPEAGAVRAFVAAVAEEIGRTAGQAA